MVRLVEDERHARVDGARLAEAMTAGRLGSVASIGPTWQGLSSIRPAAAVRLALDTLALLYARTLAIAISQSTG